MRAPKDLHTEGRALWRRIERWLAEHPDGPVSLDPHEVAILAEACRGADRLAQLRAALADVDLTEPHAVRLLAEERQQRATLSLLLCSRLGLPTGLPDGAGKGSTPRSRRAQRAARARWDREVS